MIRVDLQGATLVLLPERAAFWERTGTLFVADSHVGKAATFRAAAIPLPGGTTTEALARLTAALERTGARRLLILGDFFHARRGGPPAPSPRCGLARRHGDRRSCSCAATTTAEPAIRPASGDSTVTTALDRAAVRLPAPSGGGAGGIVLAGHIHPAVSLAGPGRQRRGSLLPLRRADRLLPAFAVLRAGPPSGPGAATGSMRSPERKLSRSRPNRTHHPLLAHLLPYPSVAKEDRNHGPSQPRQVGVSRGPNSSEWVVSQEKAEFRKEFETKDEAVQFAKERAREEELGQVEVDRWTATWSTSRPTATIDGVAELGGCRRTRRAAAHGSRRSCPPEFSAPRSARRVPPSPPRP